MNIAFQSHWLEDAIGNLRTTSEIAQAIVTHPEFQTLISESVRFAKQKKIENVDQTRLIAEHIIALLSKSMNGYTSMHD